MQGKSIALQGKGLSSGIGVGKALIYHEDAIAYEKVRNANPEIEMKRFTLAVASFAKNVNVKTSKEQAGILDAHIVLAQDPEVARDVKEYLLENHSNAEEAIDVVLTRSVHIFETFDDEMWRSRAHDITDVRDSLLRELLMIRAVNLSEIVEDTILCLHELTPSIMTMLISSHIVGLVLEQGSAASHAAILARSQGIPAVVVEDVLRLVQESNTLLIDGQTGLLQINPIQREVRIALSKKNDKINRITEAHKFKGLLTHSCDGKRIEVFCNIGRTSDCEQALANGAEGIGLFRTEFFYMESDALPTEEEQFEAYKQVLTSFSGKRVVFRTLDVGGDKVIPSLYLEKEDNPFLGFRAIRYCLSHPDVFSTQLRAMLRASAFGKASIMLPMISSLQELRSARCLLEKIKGELRQDNLPFDPNIPLGIMIETPAAALMADALAKECDFFSIGTNDLIQYTTAVDRGNEKIASLYSPYHPAVIRLISIAAAAAQSEGIPISMCGEAAADVALIPVWLGLGIHELSVYASKILSTRDKVMKTSIAESKKMVGKILLMHTTEEVQRYLVERW